MGDGGGIATGRQTLKASLVAAPARPSDPAAASVAMSNAHAAERARNRAIKQLERLGHKVILEEPPQAA